MNNTAAFASSIGDTTKTIRLLLESIELSKRVRDTSWLVKLYINAVAAYTDSHQYDVAEDYLYKAAPLIKTTEIWGALLDELRFALHCQRGLAEGNRGL